MLPQFHFIPICKEDIISSLYLMRVFLNNRLTTLFQRKKNFGFVSYIVFGNIKKKTSLKDRPIFSALYYFCWHFFFSLSLFYSASGFPSFGKINLNPIKKVRSLFLLLFSLVRPLLPQQYTRPF